MKTLTIESLFDYARRSPTIDRTIRIFVTNRKDMSTKSLITTLGFLLSGIGILSLVYKMIGLQLSFLTWIDAFGALTGLIIRLFFIFGGLVMIYLTKVDMDV